MDGHRATVTDPERGFALDPFQEDACKAIDVGRSVLVAAPTGAGKTLIAEHAVQRVFHAGGRAFYTTPIKALSNQKFRDFAAEFGEANVGLLTGDSVVNAAAPIVVMTTEVLRNMLYSHADNLAGLELVILDEVHFLQDPYRGAVWEEVIIQAPASVQFVYLSATVSNVHELAGWLAQVRGSCDFVVESERPVALRHHYLVASPREDRLRELAVIIQGQANPDGAGFDSKLVARAHGGKPDRPRRRWNQPDAVSVARRLSETDRLPAIHFIFSRAGCTNAARSLYESGIKLTSAQEVAAIDRIADEHFGVLTASDRLVLNTEQFLEMMRAGIAPHHAGLVPPYKTAVEECFALGLLKVVYATETLALGINMPARSVVIDTLSRYRGDGHHFLTPGEFTQLSGRAGRRGLDDVGDVFILWSPYVAFSDVADLVASREFWLNSAFRPTYNMVSNLVSGQSPVEARQLLEQSFGQYQRGGQLQRLKRHRRTLAQQLKKMRSARPARRDPRAIARISASLTKLDDEIAGARDSIADRFGRMLTVLEDFGFLDGWELTDSGKVLTAIFHEHDVLVALAVASGVFDDITAPELAALASVFTYQHRTREDPGPAQFPSAELRHRFRRIEEMQGALQQAEDAASLDSAPPIEATFVAHTYAWASGHSLADVLDDEMTSGGDFVRNIRQVSDMCSQIAKATRSASVRARAHAAADLLNRDIIVAGDVSAGVRGGDASEDLSDAMAPVADAMPPT